jgi:probable addiction module antidote protein
MPRKGRPFQEFLLEQLVNPEVAKHYLNDALDESPEQFLSALKTVAQARQMTSVARDAGVQRETLYRSLSSQGNPTLDTLSSILKAVGLKVLITETEEDAPAHASPVKNRRKLRATTSGPITAKKLGPFMAGK